MTTVNNRKVSFSPRKDCALYCNHHGSITYGSLNKDEV
jgi:hypothetical protein